MDIIIILQVHLLTRSIRCLDPCWKVRPSRFSKLGNIWPHLISLYPLREQFQVLLGTIRLFERIYSATFDPKCVTNFFRFLRVRCILFCFFVIWAGNFLHLRLGYLVNCLLGQSQQELQLKLTSKPYFLEIRSYYPL